MILYNVTIAIEPGIEQEWLNWMRTKHIPEVMDTGLFLENKICRILSGEEGECSYSIQYLCASMIEYEAYQNKHAQRLQKEHLDRYNGKFGAFRTLLEVIHQA